ncbi:MAG: hypothetical protein L0Y54_02940 [Sporichthyaceae bacterium]|nr:hypothetical protein [Sporichthyaceae bacterium]
MAGKQSKTARASMRAGTASTAVPTTLGEVRYLIPLNHGKNVYVRNIVQGKTRNLRTDSEAFVEEIRGLAEAGHGAKIKAELETFTTTYPGDGWEVTLKRLIETGALA